MIDLVDALKLPTEAIVNKRVPKSLLTEYGAATPAQRRLIRDGIEEIRWIAVLKPVTVGTVAFTDEEREYLEIIVLEVRFSAGAKSDRLTDLIHRAVPYPVLLIASDGEVQMVSTAHKRRSRRDPEQFIVDGEIVTARFDDKWPRSVAIQFRNAIGLPNRSIATLYDLYRWWTVTVQSLQAAAITGALNPPTTLHEAANQSGLLKQYRDVERRIAKEIAAASKESQIARLAEHNLAINDLRSQLNALASRL